MRCILQGPVPKVFLSAINLAATAIYWPCDLTLQLQF